MFKSSVLFKMKFVCALTVAFLFNSVHCMPQKNDLFELSIIHMNDFHARFEETDPDISKCKAQPCIGGLGRIITEVYTILSQKPDSIVLNAGDNFQGTLYYNIFKYNITAHFLNTLPLDAITLGNHEFDDGVEGVVPFIKELTAPVVVSNIDDTLEPQIQGLYKKSTIIERGGKKIGIIGVLIHSCNEISNTGHLKFFDESESVNKEAERLVREEGVFTNIVLSHSGYGIEKLIAQKATNKIGLIVGGHSHSFLYTGEHSPGTDKVEGPYPTIMTNQDGNTVLVVQASAYSKYMGNITVFYDSDGNVKDWSGEPLYLENEIEQDPNYISELQPWKEIVDATGDKIIGSSLVRLEKNDCRMGECLEGSFVCDAMVYAYTANTPPGRWTNASIALMNTGGLRTTIPKGNITFGDLITAQPFGNVLYVGDVTGQDLKDIFEFSATPYFYGRAFININLLQVAGVQVTIDIRKPIGSRITSLKLRCAECEIPVYEDVNPYKIYKIIVPSFLLSGGDGFAIIPQRLKNIEAGRFDIDVFLNFLKDKGPVIEEKDGRITILGEEKIVAKKLDS